MNASGRAPSPAVGRAVGMGNAWAGPMGWRGGNGSEESQEHGQEQSYRHFTTAVQLLIFVGSLLGESSWSCFFF